MEILFGRSLEPAEKSRRYVGESKSLVRCEESWASEWKAYLDTLWNSKEPLEAKFGEAWLRQDNQKRRRIPQTDPWHMDAMAQEPWWVKERNEIALMQLASERQQALIWCGERQIIDLAAITFCVYDYLQIIWATWQRRNPTEADKHTTFLVCTDDQLSALLRQPNWFKKIR